MMMMMWYYDVYRVDFCFWCNRYIFIFSLGRERERRGWGVPSIVIARATLEPFLTPHSHTFIENSPPPIRRRHCTSFENRRI